MDTQAAPARLGRLVVGGFLALLAAITALAAALTLGAADPHPVGPLAWEADFAAGAPEAEWQVSSDTGVRVDFGAGGLVVELAAPEQIAIVARATDGDTYTFAASGAQVGGQNGALYGIVFDLQSAVVYSAVALNNNGFVRAYRRRGEEQEDWFALQQWPHVLLDDEINELRIDVMDGAGTIRINQEVLLSAPVGSGGDVGLIAVGRAPEQVVGFENVRLWMPDR